MKDRENTRFIGISKSKVGKNEAKYSVMHHNTSKLERMRAVKHDVQSGAEHYAEEMMKAIEDFRHTFREEKNKVRTSHRAVTGWLRDRSNRSLHHTSLLERDFCFLCLFHHAVEHLYEQPLTITGRDSNGKIRSYTPDFLVEFKTGSGASKRCLVEVKPVSDLENADSGLRERLDLGKRWAAVNGFMFEVVTESQIRSAALSNVVAVLPFRFYDPDIAVQFDIQVKVANSPGLTVAELTDQIVGPHLPKDIVLREIWITIACGLVHFDVAKTLSPNTALFEYPVWTDEYLFFARDGEL